MPACCTPHLTVTPDLEGACLRMVLVFDPYRKPGVTAEQRPYVLRCRRHLPVDDFRCRA